MSMIGKSTWGGDNLRLVKTKNGTYVIETPLDTATGGVANGFSSFTDVGITATYTNDGVQKIEITNSTTAAGGGFIFTSDAIPVEVGGFFGMTVEAKNTADVELATYFNFYDLDDVYISSAVITKTENANFSAFARTTVTVPAGAAFTRHFLGIMPKVAGNTGTGEFRNLKLWSGGGGGSYNDIAEYGDYIYLCNGNRRTVQKRNKSDLELVAESADYGGTLNAIAIDGSYIYAAGGAVQRVFKYNLTDLVKVAESDSYTQNITVLTAHRGFVYAAGVAVQKIYKYNTSDLTKVAESDAYGGTPRIIYAKGAYIYMAGDTIRKAFKYNTSDLTKVAETDDYGGAVYALFADDAHLYVGGVSVYKVFKHDISDLVKVAESPDLGVVAIRGIKKVGTSLYLAIGGSGVGVRRLRASDLSLLETTALKTNKILLAVACDDTHIYACGNEDRAHKFKALAFPKYPLDGVDGVAIACSIRLLSTQYKGNPLIRVRRASDNAELDIGHLPNGDLDTETLLSFVGASTGHVTKMYDQSINGCNIQQGTGARQPTIVNAGVMQYINGNIPSPTYVATAKSSMFASKTTTTIGFNDTPFDILFVFKETNVAHPATQFVIGSTTSECFEAHTTTHGIRAVGRPNAPYADTAVLGAGRNKVAAASIRMDGVNQYARIEKTTSAPAAKAIDSRSTLLGIGCRSNSAFYLEGFVPEYICLKGVSDERRDSIEANQISYYGII
jgi:hypothetical protein